MATFDPFPASQYTLAQLDEAHAAHRSWRKQGPELAAPAALQIAGLADAVPAPVRGHFASACQVLRVFEGVLRQPQGRVRRGAQAARLHRKESAAALEVTTLRSRIVSAAAPAQQQLPPTPPPQQQQRRSSANAAAAAAASTAGAAAAATVRCGLPGAAVTAAAAPPRPSSGLLNELRLQAGKSTLGSLNPLIDANAASFNDVTTGSSSGSCGFPRRLARDQGLRRRVGRRCAQLREARHGGDGAALDAEGEGPGGRAAAASWRSDRVCLARNGGGGALCRLSKRWGLLAALPRAVLAPHWGLRNQTRGALG